MAYFVIGGLPDCPDFIHAIYVASYLYNKLPSFEFTKIDKCKLDYAAWLDQLNKENGWYHTKSPIIMKAISMRGGKKYLIGGLSEFWEYCFDYYGLESNISKSDLEKLVKDNMRVYQDSLNHKEYMENNVRHITISGASNEKVCVLLADLFNVPNLPSNAGLHIKLYDHESQEDKSKERFMTATAEEFNHLYLYGNQELMSVVGSLKEAITNCDLFIEIGCFIKKAWDTETEWLQCCAQRMYMLADTINKHGKRTLRVVFNHHGPVCFNATCLVNSCTGIRTTNIVAVTSDVGLSTMEVASRRSGIPKYLMSGPPVWGFIGINRFVDVRSIIIKADVLKPYPRAVNARPGTTLPLGTVMSELRLLSYKIEDAEDIVNESEQRKELIVHNLKQPPSLAKFQSLISLVTLWYSKEVDDSIISLGVTCNGSFGFPHGIVLSQPCILDKRKIWVPFKNFPISSSYAKSKIQDLGPEAVQIYEKIIGKMVA